MTSLTLDTEKIENLISNGNYKKASELIFQIIESDYSNKELNYKCLSLLNLICDKTPSISIKVVKNITIFINEADSWIRLLSLEILYQISLYRPNLLIVLIDKIRARLYDQDPSVRRLTVKIIGNLILSLHVDLHELQNLIEEFNERLMDNDWRVKLQVIKTLKKILNQDYTKIKDLEPLLSIVIVNLRDEDDDVARAAAELLKVLSNYFLSKDKIFYILLNLLYNEKNRVKELIIWLFGEIGREKSSEIIPIIPKLTKFLKEDDYRIQKKVTDAIVKIAENNFDQIWANLVHLLLDLRDKIFRNNLINALYYLSQNNIAEIFTYLFEELENPSENIREGIALVFQRLFEEYQIEIENEITKIIFSLQSKYWRIRKKTIILLQNICFILKSEKIAVWITIELNKLLEKESDPDVKNEINYTCQNIKTSFNNINKSIEKINNELSLLRSRIIKFRRIPSQFRENLNSYIQEFRFNNTEIQLNKRYRRILKKIKKFNEILNRFEYKRLAFDLIEDWEETKIQIIDELSIIKSFISEICEEKKKEFLSKLKIQINLMMDRIDVLKAKFDYIKDQKFNLNADLFLDNIDSGENLEEKFTYINQLREDLFQLDGDIRDLLIHNLEFNEIFKELLEKWIFNKIQIQEYFGEVTQLIKIIKEKIVNYYYQIDESSMSMNKEKIGVITNELAFQIIQSHVQSIISQGIEGLEKFHDNFDSIKTKSDFFIKRKEFINVKKIIELNNTQIQAFIEETEAKIDSIIGKEKIFKDNNMFSLFVRPFLNKWNETKEILINKLKKFIGKSYEKLYLSQFKHYLKIMNPIKFDFLSSYIGLEKEQLKELVLKLINKGKLNAKIVNDSLYSQSLESDIPNFKEILFFKNVKTIGNKIFLDFKLNNPSNFIYRDIQLSLKVPSYLRFLKKESFPKILYLNELKQGSIFKFNYVLKIEKDMKKDLSESDEIILNYNYRDPFRIDRSKTIKISLLLS